MRSRGPRILEGPGSYKCRIFGSLTLEGLMGLYEVQRSPDLKLSEGVDR